MRFRTFIVGLVLTLVVFLFAQRHSGGVAQQTSFRGVVDLTHAIDISVRPPDLKSPSAGVHPASAASSHNHNVPEQFATEIDAPAQLARNLWTVDQIPAERLIASLVVIDVRQE